MQNNFVMVNFGKEDLKMIDEREFIDRIVKQNKISGVKIPDEVLKIIHFNPKYPQLSNIYISDINREKCMVYEDGEWKLSNVDNIPQIMDKVCVFSAEQINNLKTKHPDNKPLHERLGVIEKYNNKSLIVSPTMLLPQNVSKTNNAYYATMSILYNLLVNQKVDVGFSLGSQGPLLAFFENQLFTGCRLVSVRKYLE